MGGISWYQLLIVLVIVILVFGTKKLKNVGSDLGEAVKGFKKGIKDEDDKPELTEQKTESTSEKVESKDSGNSLVSPS